MIQLPRSGGVKSVMADNVPGSYFHSWVVAAENIKTHSPSATITNVNIEFFQFVVTRRQRKIYAQGNTTHYD